MTTAAVTEQYTWDTLAGVPLLLIEASAAARQPVKGFHVGAWQAGRVDEQHPDERAVAPGDAAVAPDDPTATSDARGTVPDRTGGARPGPPPRPGRGALAVELVGVVAGVGVLSLPVVTVLPAVAGGAGHLRRVLAGERPGVLGLWREVVSAVRATWAYALAVAALVVVLWADLGSARSDVLLGSTQSTVFTALLLTVLAVVLLRACAGPRRHGEPWREVLRDAGRRTGDDLAGSGLLVVAIAACAGLVLVVPLLVVLVPGLLTVAAVGVERVRGARTGRL